MLRRALNHATLAAALLIPTLAGVALQAPPASATPVLAQASGSPFEGQAVVNATEDSGTNATWTAAFPDTPGQTCQWTFDNVIQTSTGSISPYFFSASGSFNLCVAAEEYADVSDGFSLDNHWTATEVTLRDYGASSNLGSFGYLLNHSTPGLVTETPDANTTYYITPGSGYTTYFDSDPLSGTIGTARPSAYELYVQMGIQQDSPSHGYTLDSRGNLDFGTTLGSAFDQGAYAQGYVDANAGGGFLYGGTPFGSSASAKLTDLADQQGATYGINKNYSMVRSFDSTWGTPNANVRTWAAQGKAVEWSVAPAGFTGHTSTVAGQWTNLTVSPWAASANDTAGLKAQVQALEDDANQTGGPPFMTWTITHEPHDNTDDTTKGWDSGNSDAKCGDNVTQHNFRYGIVNKQDACYGSVAEFATLVNAMKTAQQNDCDINGGITGVGHPCSKVLISYIGVPDNMTPGGSNSTKVGSADLMNPSAFISSVDVIGGDPYNYGCFRKAVGTCTTANGWDTFQTTVDKAGASTDVDGHPETLLGLAARYDKPVILDEVGSHPGCNGSETDFGCNGSSTGGAGTGMDRDTWFNGMWQTLETDPLAVRYIIGFDYFHTKATYDWRYIPTSVNPSPDTRGLTTYKSTFGSRSSYKTTANGYAYTLTP